MKTIMIKWNLHLMKITYSNPLQYSCLRNPMDRDPGGLLKKVSRGPSRVEAGNPGFPRLVQVTSGGFSWWL